MGPLLILVGCSGPSYLILAPSPVGVNAGALARVAEIHTADRRNVIDREVAAKHIGYNSISGASDKALATLAHYNLLEKAGKGQTRVTQLAVDILHPESEQSKKKALLEAAYYPDIFAEIRTRFSDGQPSESALKSWLTRENFLDRAIGPVVASYMETVRFLEQERAFESGSPSSGTEGKSPPSDDTDEADSRDVKFGGAKVGDLIQWESGGVLQLDKPRAVRYVSDDGLWVAIEDSETGIPMSEVIVETPASVKPPAPVFPFAPPARKQDAITNDPNHIKIVVDQEKLHITANNIDLVGLNRLRRQLDKYAEILKLNADDEDEIPQKVE